jgi:hypothetical protein
VRFGRATITIAAAATWLATSDRPDAVAVAIAKALIAWTVTVGIFPFVQFGFWLIRSNSIQSLTDPLTELANRRGLVTKCASSQRFRRVRARSTPRLWAFDAG